MLSVKKNRERRERLRRQAAVAEFLRVVQEAGSTPELIQAVADRRFYMKCCAALTGRDENKGPEMRRLYRELEQEARRRGLLPEDIKKRLEPVAGVLGLGPARAAQEGLQADYYRVLGVPADAGEEAVKKAYHRKARQTHPDTQNGDRNQFLAVHEAYEVLADPDRRRHYDASRAHAMHLGWSEDARVHQGDSAERDFPAGQERSALWLIAVVVAVLVAVAVVVDMMIRG